MSIEIIGPEAEALLSWQGLTDAIEAGHRLPRAEIKDLFLYRGKDTILNRAAWIDGLAQLVKVATIFPDNPAQGLPSIHGAVNLFDDRTGDLTALVDFHLVTKWKTAGDSLLSAKRLARPDARVILLMGAGPVSRSMVEAYSSHFTDARFLIWNRTAAGAEAIAASDARVRAVTDLPAAVAQADIVCSATMTKEPILRGEWLKAGQHIDLIGAYRPDMREADDMVMQRGTVFVDSRATTVHHIGEIMDPIANGTITEADIRADFYDIAAGLYKRSSDDEITLAKNGGGAHLDLMTAHYIMTRWQGR